MWETLAAGRWLFGPLLLLLLAAVGWLFVWVAEHSPGAAFLQSCGGVVAPYANMLGVLFGLLAAFLFSDAWLQHEKTSAAVGEEADALRTVVTLTRAAGERGRALAALAAAYGDAVTGPEWHSPERAATAHKLTAAMLTETLTGGFAAAGSRMQRLVSDQLGVLRDAYRARFAAADPSERLQKWVGTLVIGVFTLASMVIVQLGRPRASMLAVTLFGSAMAFVLWVILVRLDPFAGPQGISLEPIRAAYTDAP